MPSPRKVVSQMTPTAPTFSRGPSVRRPKRRQEAAPPSWLADGSDHSLLGRREDTVDSPRLTDTRREERDAHARNESELLRAKEEAERWSRLGSSEIPETMTGLPPSIVDGPQRGSDRYMQCWVLDDHAGLPQYGPHSLRPGRRRGPGIMAVTLRDLKELGVCYWRISIHDFTTVNLLCRERRYKHTDEVHLHQTAKDEAFLDRWFQEHYHEDEQIRLVTDGSCYIDVRSKTDTWIRCHLTAGDLLVIPPGLYHRGTLDEDDFAVIMRVFRDAARWLPVCRSEQRAEQTQARLKYREMVARGTVAQDLGFT
eukprot:TRINITY_DN304_c0_g3_i1.p1 TRINITY_DN304_c0_g3~~TRINITY_DN304_c0_g3_i1.p1  ORF type:complete len:338 (+),score=66.02 TRINITY_DN304_c0_g3_i1:84-1016(+)